MEQCSGNLITVSLMAQGITPLLQMFHKIPTLLYAQYTHLSPFYLLFYLFKVNIYWNSWNIVVIPTFIVFLAGTNLEHYWN